MCDIKKYCYMLVVLQAFVLASLIPGAAFAKTPYQPYKLSQTDMASMATAQKSNGVTQVFCNIELIMSGTTGTALAVVALIAVGVGSLFGRITSDMAIVVTLGIGLVFGASSMVGSVGGNDTTCKAHDIDGDCAEYDYGEYGYSVEETICTGAVIQYMQKD